MTKEIYVLWKRQKDNLGTHNKVSRNKELKDYRTNNYLGGQYDTILEARQNAAVTECSQCNNKLGPDTKIYYGTPILCRECKKQEKVAEKL